MKERPNGGREEKARGADAPALRGAPAVYGREEEPPVRGRDVDEPPVRGRDVEYERGEAPVPLLNDFFCSIYCSKRPVYTGLN